MKPTSLVFMTVISLMAWTLVAQSVQAQTRLAIHATQEEVDIWKQRRSNGPYKDDWTRILNRANKFKANPTGLWKGNEQNQAWNGDQVKACKHLPTVYPGSKSTNCTGDDSRQYADGIRDAAFVYLVTGDTSYRDPVRTLLLQQASLAGTKFDNTVRWPTTYINQDKDFHISLWLFKMTLAYSYIRESLSAGDKATLDAWFVNAATWFNHMVHNSAVNRFSHRLTQPDNFTYTGSCGALQAKTHIPNGHDAFATFTYDNKQALHNAFVAAVGAITENQTLINRAKRFTKEWLVVNTWPDGTVFDQMRGMWQGTSNPQTGYHYSTKVVATHILTADHLARIGDMDLYTWSTTQGACGSAGGPKSLLNTVLRSSQLTLGQLNIYASSDGSTHIDRRIDPVEANNSWMHVEFFTFAVGNRFFQHSLIQQAYNRSLTSNLRHPGADPYGGAWGLLPGARLMFAGMEGKAWPYGAKGTKPLPFPENLRIMLHHP